MIREQRKRKKRRKIGLTVFLILALLVAVAVYVVMTVYTVESVVVEGNELYSEDQIKKIILNDEYSWNSLYVDLKYRFLDAEETPFVDAMEISLDDPHTVHVRVYEKGILGYLYIPSINQNAYFDKDGFVVETSTEIIDGMPLISGVTCNEVYLYQQLSLENDKVLENLLALTQTLNKYELLPEEIRYDNSLNPTLTYGTIQVEMGDDAYLNQKVVRLSAILPQLAGLEGTLHLEGWTPDTVEISFERAVEPEPADNEEAGDNEESGDDGAVGDNAESGDNAETGDDGANGDNAETGDGGVSGDNAETGDGGVSGDNAETGDNGVSGDNPEAQ